VPDNRPKEGQVITWWSFSKDCNLVRSWRRDTKEPINIHRTTHRYSSVNASARDSSLQYLCCSKKANQKTGYKWLISCFLMQSLRHWLTLPSIWTNFNTSFSRTLTSRTNLSLGYSATSTHVPYSSRVWNIAARTWLDLSPSSSCNVFSTGSSHINSRSSD
jgi:hypothetical protein